MLNSENCISIRESEQPNTVNIIYLLYLRHVSAELHGHYQVVVHFHKKGVLRRGLFLQEAYTSLHKFVRLADDGCVLRPKHVVNTTNI
jgi:hypothetical protein